MRTTLTLDADVADRIGELMRLRDQSLKQTVNDLIRRGMAADSGRSPSRKRFKVKAHRGGFRAGVDLLKLNQLADELEADAFVAQSDGA